MEKDYVFFWLLKNYTWGCHKKRSRIENMLNQQQNSMWKSGEFCPSEDYENDNIK